MARLQIRRGTKSALPSSGMLEGELLVTTDKHTLHVATGATTQVPVVPDIIGLSSIDTVDLAADYLLIHDGSTALEKRVLGSDLKTALTAIPPPSTGAILYMYANFS